MKPPRLNVPLILEEPLNGADGMGGIRPGWSERGRIWGRLDSAGGRERQAQVGSESVTSFRITVRGALQGCPRRPAAGQRFRHGLRIFRIEAVAERDPSGRWLTCFVREEMQ